MAYYLSDMYNRFSVGQATNQNIFSSVKPHTGCTYGYNNRVKKALKQLLWYVFLIVFYHGKYFQILLQRFISDLAPITCTKRLVSARPTKSKPLSSLSLT